LIRNLKLLIQLKILKKNEMIFIQFFTEQIHSSNYEIKIVLKILVDTIRARITKIQSKYLKASIKAYFFHIFISHPLMLHIYELMKIHKSKWKKILQNQGSWFSLLLLAISPLSFIPSLSFNNLLFFCYLFKIYKAVLMKLNFFINYLIIKTI